MMTPPDEQGEFSLSVFIESVEQNRSAGSRAVDSGEELRIIQQQQ
ncbi:MAG TPA: hypothetical protein VFK79_03625 [Xanthobacteraceae bacterium]|nr:hypothetical protein [Xanthobacteraceae bacterium]